MTELTEQKIAEYDAINTTFENTSTDLAKFQALLNDAKTQLDVLISEGYKNPEERKAMQVNDSVYFRVKNLEEDIAGFEAKKTVADETLADAKTNGYKTPLERIAAEKEANAKVRAEKEAQKALLKEQAVKEAEDAQKVKEAANA